MDLACKIEHLKDEDLPRIGSLIKVGEDELHAFLDVETRGSGYDKRGRLVACYEPHKAYQFATGATRDKLVARGLAYPNWGQKPYPTDPYPSIIACMAVDEDVAIRATSWGIGQIMGFNYVAAGYNSAHAMLQGFLELGEAEQLEAAVRFIIHEHLDDELREHRWEAFARGYNGPGYARNNYHTKLKLAFEKWSKIRNTPWKGQVNAPPLPLAKTLRDALNSQGPKIPVVDAAPSAPTAAVVQAQKPFWQRFVEGLRAGAS